MVQNSVTYFMDGPEDLFAFSQYISLSGLSLLPAVSLIKHFTFTFSFFGAFIERK